MKRKIVSIGLCMAMAATMLAGCGGGGEADKASKSADAISAGVSKDTEMTFIYADGDEGMKEVMTTIVDKFNSTYSDVTINVEPGNGGTYPEFIQTKDAVGEFPDMLEMREPALYVRAGKLAPLSDEVKGLFEDVVEFDGEAYTAPMAGNNVQGIMYNRKFFQENGINENPQTYDEFIQICKDIQAAGMTPLAVGGNDLWHMGFWFNKFYTDEVITKNQNFIADMYDDNKTSWQDDNAKAVLQDMVDLFEYVDAGWASTPDSQITTMLISEKAAMIFSGTHMFSQISAADPNFDYGWFAVPDKDGNTNLVGGSSPSGWSLSAEAAKDPDKQIAFDTFCKFFFNDENYKMYCEKMSAIPTLKENPQLDVCEQMQSALDALDTADLKINMWNNQLGDNELPSEFRNYCYKVVTEVIQGTKTIDEGAAELDKEWASETLDFNPVKGIQ
ncbi:MAG: ABC transporter substrate-binding protein [Lachnospiraceae bacterium]